MKNDFVEGVRELVRRQDDEDAAAHDLWSFLPSRKVAERHHGNYFRNLQPSVADILREAAMVLAEHAGSKLDPEERAEWCEKCPCGEPHEGNGEDAVDPAAKDAPPVRAAAPRVVTLADLRTDEESGNAEVAIAEDTIYGENGAVMGTRGEALIVERKAARGQVKIRLRGDEHAVFALGTGKVRRLGIGQQEFSSDTLVPSAAWTGSRNWVCTDGCFILEDAEGRSLVIIGPSDNGWRVKNFNPDGQVVETFDLPSRAAAEAEAERRITSALAVKTDAPLSVEGLSATLLGMRNHLLGLCRADSPAGTALNQRIAATASLREGEPA